jgi:hypothetical protein
MRRFLVTGFTVVSPQLGNAIKAVLKKAAANLPDSSQPVGQLFRTPNGLLKLTYCELIFGVHQSKKKLGFKYHSLLSVYSFCQTDNCQIWLNTDEDWATDFLTRAVKALGWEIKEI